MNKLIGLMVCLVSVNAFSYDPYGGAKAMCMDYCLSSNGYGYCYLMCNLDE